MTEMDDDEIGIIEIDIVTGMLIWS